MADYTKFIMRPDRANSLGQHPIRLRITKGKVKYISLNLSGTADFWDETNECFIILKGLKGEQQKRLNEERKANNAILERYKVKANDIINEFEKAGIDWTLNQFEDAFCTRGKRGKVQDYFDTLIETLKATNHIGNAACYENTLRLLKLFDKRFDTRIFSEIDIRYVKDFDVFLQKRECKGNTRKYYFKALRSVLNKAIQDNVADAAAYPFGKGGFEVAKLEEITEKRYLPADYLLKLKTQQSEVPTLEYARLLFLLSYYCYGISFIDMALLTDQNIIRCEDGKYIVYKREKIKNQKNVRPIQIKITQEIESLLQRVMEFGTPLKPYLLPIVTRADYSGGTLYNHIRGRYHKYNNYLSQLAGEFGFEGINLTSYVSRHTMAMTLQGHNVPREVISQILGHNDMATTNAYLDSFGNNVINEAVKVL